MSNLLTLLPFECGGQLGENSSRLLHGRGHTYPGLKWLTVDWHPPAVVATVYKDPGEAALQALFQQLEQLSSRWSVPVFIQYRFSYDVPFQWLGDQPSEPLFATRNGLRFELNLGARQNLGYFVDMEPGRLWLEEHGKGRGLNLFAYTCALSAVALAGGASEVINVDMSRSALTVGQRNHQLNNLKGGRFLKMDVFKSWKKLAANGPYNWIVLDPPSFQKGSFVAEKDYPKLVRHLTKVVSSGTKILACLNAPELGVDFLKTTFASELPSAELVEQLAEHPQFPERYPDRGLKLLSYQVH